MARERSIPQPLELAIVRRWTLGHSAQEILDWIEERNAYRVTPVQTSRSSVERVIRRWEAAGQGISATAFVNRMRRDAPAQIDVLQKIQRRYLKMAKEARTLEVDAEELPQDRARHSLETRSLMRAEILALRTIRAAGLGGQDGDKVFVRNAPLTLQANETLSRERAGELFLEAVEEQLDQVLHSDAPAEVIPSALQPANDEEAPPFESTPSGETSPIETHASEPVVPILEEPPVPLEGPELEQFKRLKAVTNHWLFVAFTAGVRNPPLLLVDASRQVGPDASPGEQLVPHLEVPTWKMPAESRAAFLAHLARINGWLAALSHLISERANESATRNGDQPPPVARRAG
jgi:hypothetical protein